MKAITMIILTIFLGKSCSDCAQNDIANASIRYTANSRGFFQEIVVANHKATISHDRKGIEKPQEIAISDKDWQELVGYFEKVDLEKIPDLKDPTQKRFYDGAAAAELKITYKEKEYQTKSFDHGFPPVAIEKLVNKIVSLDKQE